MRVLGLFGIGSGTAVNLFYLAGYAVVGVATAFVLRRLRVSRLSSLGAVVLFALLPYRCMRGESSHLFLAMYWIVPLVLLVLVWLDSSGPPLVKPCGGRWFPLEA